ncbi:ECF transporter S component [Mesoplasma entomophilum]|uniref:folate family ECF transporter S component n=1 Tax=Mesoplasma entomophilum TaxID=2149 RepID=UPI000D043DBA|nr:folate family ECF transporter S component [Mesoplasma entomophilum]AVN60082.1 ECF transporter S component [Mesoplasma entomophilum]
MLFWITNIIAVVLILSMFFIGMFIDKIHAKKFTVKNIALLGLIVALSIILTNVIGYSSVFGFQIMIGNFMIFFAGMVFGPLGGIMAGFCSDLVGSMIHISGTFHFGFMLAKIFIGFCGSMVFIFRNNNLWFIKMIFFLIFSLAITSFLITPICLVASGLGSLAAINYVKKIIILPIELLIFIPSIYACLKLSSVLLKSEIQQPFRPWFLRHGQLKFKTTKSTKK